MNIIVIGFGRTMWNGRDRAIMMESILILMADDITIIMTL